MADVNNVEMPRGVPPHPNSLPKGVRFGSSPAWRTAWAGAAAAWVALVLLTAWLWWQYRADYIHFRYGPTLLLIAILAVAGVWGTAVGAVRLVRGPRRWVAWRLVAASALPGLLALTPGVYAWIQWNGRHVPNNFLMRTATLEAASLMEAQADWLYPHRLYSPRIVMFYRDLSDPQGELAAMERHVAELEELLGRPLRERIWWVRGKLLRQELLSLFGLALGSDPSAGYGAGGLSLDRHELAHAVIRQYGHPDCVPPTLLAEGWAEAAMGHAREDLVVAAMAVHEDKAIGVADLLGPEWYHQDSGPVYSIGGAWVDYLLRRYGYDRFLAWYVNASDETVLADFRSVYGVELSEVEEQFWREMERRAGAASEAPPPPVAPGAGP